MGPDGKVYTCWMYEEGKWFVSGWGPDGLPLEGKYLADKVGKGRNTSSSQKGLPDDCARPARPSSTALAMASGSI